MLLNIIDYRIRQLMSSFLKRFFSIKCNAYGKTDVGRVRKHNEDNVHMNRDNNFFMLADGMGGRRG